MTAQIARSGLLLLALKPHRTTRQRSVESSAEPAICHTETSAAHDGLRFDRLGRFGRIGKGNYAGDARMKTLAHPTCHLAPLAALTW
jgi:hypothetical protein